MNNNIKILTCNIASIITKPAANISAEIIAAIQLIDLDDIINDMLYEFDD